MRADQIENLRNLVEKLADVVLEEADPDQWPGAGQPLASVDQQTRGDRYWCKKNAAASFSLLERCQSVVNDAGSVGGQQDRSEDLQRDIDKAEKAAAKALDAAMKRAKSATHGKT